MSYFNTVTTQPGDNFGIDAFGRNRVSQPDTLFDSKQIFNSGSLVWDDQQTTGAGTSTAWSKNRASTTLSVSATTVGKRVRQSKSRLNYQPGKSQEVLATFVAGSTQSGITRRVGYFDDDNGVFFEDNGTNLGFAVRSFVTGTPVDNRVAQANWNLDKLDGTGPSGITLDITKIQIFATDLEWLGAGRVRTGFVIDGNYVYTHEFNHANNIDSVYMSNPNLPIRYEIENDGTGPSATFEAVCSTIISEGGAAKTGIPRYVSTSGTHLNANTANTIYALIGLKSIDPALTIVLESIDLLAETADSYEWMLILNPTVAGTFTYAGIGNESSIQAAYGVTANTITGGIQLGGGWASANSGRQIATEIKRTFGFGSTIAGVVDELVLCVRPLSANADIQGSINFDEIQ